MSTEGQPSARPAPTSAPATVSLSQCARRQTRSAMTPVKTTAFTSHRHRHRSRLGLGCASSTSPTAVTTVAMACPEGNAAADVSMRLPGGRGRS